MLIQFHNWSQISHSVHVVRRWPDCRKLVVKMEMIAFSAELMCPSQVVKIVKVQELLEHFWAEDVASPPGRDHEACLSILRVAPHEITKRPVMRNFLKPVQPFDLVHRLDKRRQTTMNSKNFIINDCCNWEVVKNIGKVLPNYGIAILGLTLHVEAIILCDCSGLMIASYHIHLPGISNLEQT